MRFGSLFAGIGGMDLGLERAGMECAWQVEINPFCQKVLAKHWPDVRRWDDVCTFPPDDGHDYSVDLIAGGFPCQDISLANSKGRGLDGERSGLWFQFHRIICELRPRYVLMENVSALAVRGLDRVLGSLAEIGYDAEWSMLPSCAVGSPHSRERLFLIAYRDQIRCGPGGDRVQVETRSSHWEAAKDKCQWSDMELWIREAFSYCDRPADSSEFQRVGDGVPARVDRVGACGNAVVPQVAEWIGCRIMELDACESEANTATKK